MKRFALTGCAGFVAPRHMRAIKETGNDLVAALDPYDSVGILDDYFYGVHYFKEFERFDRHLEKLRRQGHGVDYVSICSPNYLHDAHVRAALRLNADAVCEKPLVLTPKNLYALKELEEEFNQKVYTIMQLRHHPSIITLKQKIDNSTNRNHHTVYIKYIASRGNWYHHSWKGQEKLSGGLIFNLGIHFLDMLLWVFGQERHPSVLYEYSNTVVSGYLYLEKATVDFTLSCDKERLPEDASADTYRSITIDGEELEFTEGFANLHTKSYANILTGDGFGIEDVRPSIELAYQIRQEGMEIKR